MSLFEIKNVIILQQGIKINQKWETERKRDQALW